MGILKRARAAFSTLFGNTDVYSVNAGWFGGMSDFGSPSQKDATGISTYMACVRNISQDIGALPRRLYREDQDGSRTIANDHPLANVFQWNENGMQTGTTFWTTFVSHMLAWWNAYAYIERYPNGRPRALSLLLPDRTKAIIVNGEKKYQTFIGSEMVYLEESEVFHVVSGLSFNGIMGLNPLEINQEVIGTAVSSNKFRKAFFANGARPGGVVTFPNGVSPEAMANVRKSFEMTHGGVANWHKTMVLDAGAKYEQMGISPEHAQLLESGKFQVEEIARLFRMPLHMVGSLDRATFSNIEHQSLEYVKHTLLPHIRAIEAEISRKLISDKDRDTVYPEFDVDGMLRGDMKSRYESYAIGRQWGFLDVNDIRTMENLPKIPNGDIYLQPSNMVEAGSTPDPKALPAAPADPASTVRAFAPALEAMYRTLLVREYNAWNRDGVKSTDAAAFWSAFDAKEAEIRKAKLEPLIVSIEAAMGTGAVPGLLDAAVGVFASDTERRAEVSKLGMKVAVPEAADHSARMLTGRVIGQLSKLLDPTPSPV